MGSMSIWHWAIVIVVIALLFGGRGKLSGIMGDAAKGIRPGGRLARLSEPPLPARRPLRRRQAIGVARRG